MNTPFIYIKNIIYFYLFIYNANDLFQPHILPVFLVLCFSLHIDASTCSRVLFLGKYLDFTCVVSLRTFATTGSGYIKAFLYRITKRTIKCIRFQQLHNLGGSTQWLTFFSLHYYKWSSSKKWNSTDVQSSSVSLLETLFSDVKFATNRPHGL